MYSSIVKTSMQSYLVCYPMILEEVQLGLFHLLRLILHGHVLLDYLELLSLPLKLLPHDVPLLVLKPEVLFLMLEEIVSLSLLLELFHALLVLLEALLDIFLETFELLICTVHLVLRITQFPLMLRLEVLPLVLSHFLPLLEVLYLLGLALDVLAEPGILFSFLKLFMVDLDICEVV